MGVKLVEVSDTAVQDIGTFLNYINEEDKTENTINTINTKYLSNIKKENIITKYLSIFLKRVLDIIGGIVGIIFLIPLTIIVKISNIKNGDKGPVFYKQRRIGKNGKEFEMLKYRTMIIGADEKLKQYLYENEKAKLEYKIYKKLRNDPRVTKTGIFLRKTSLDEMPQLIHLLTRQNVTCWT